MLQCYRGVTQIDIRPMTSRDIDEVVTLQIKFLDGSLVTDLGPRFLGSFHRAALQHSDTRAFVATDRGSIVGLAVGSLDVAKFNGYVRPRILFPLAAAIASPARWRLGFALARTLVERDPAPVIPAELLLLVVDDRCRQRGIGRTLLEKLERSLASAAITQYRVAVRSHLDVARAFYTALGFAFEQELAVLGRPMTYLTKDIAA